VLTVLRIATAHRTERALRFVLATLLLAMVFACGPEAGHACGTYRVTRGGEVREYRADEVSSYREACPVLVHREGHGPTADLRVVITICGSADIERVR
jgi:hypothetical protein